MSDVLVLAPNSGKGSRAFQGWAQKFAFVHAVPDDDVVLVDVTKPMRERGLQVLQAVDARPRLTAVALFCHGFADRVQLGFSLRKVDRTYGPADLARFVSSKTTWGNVVTVVLYACSTGADGDGGFADELRDALCREGDTYGRVDSHTTAGRADANPYVRRFDGLGSPVGGTGGQWLFAPGSAGWAKWCAALKSTDLWARFPFMSVEEIHEEVT